MLICSDLSLTCSAYIHPARLHKQYVKHANTLHSNTYCRHQAKMQLQLACVSTSWKPHPVYKVIDNFTFAIPGHSNFGELPSPELQLHSRHSIQMVA